MKSPGFVEVAVVVGGGCEDGTKEWEIYLIGEGK
jgi:hypothetical protein